nr:AAA family ATPase [Anaerolineae bacterium]
MSYYNHITDDLDALLTVLPDDIRAALQRIGRRDELLEVILDLGRVPTARYTDGEVVLHDTEVTWEEIQYVVERVGEFDADNRAGIARTLHRISAIRNRKGNIVGLTCRVGRAIYGTIAIIQDIVESGRNILLLGRPGVGKTTMLREAARVLAEKKRVIVVDTSNEIGGDGDIPHPAIGKARRMQVEMPSLQHEVMIEAVENHNPEVIIIDEIGRELEAEAARTIAERGVQLIGTAHGNTLDNLLLNPTLSDLVGGVESVTLSDEEARRRGTQKSILERRAPPTFDVLIEIQDRQRLTVHHSVAEAVDALLRGRPLQAEVRYRDEHGEIHREQVRPPSLEERETGVTPVEPSYPLPQEPLEAVNIFPYGIARNRLLRAARRQHLPVYLVDDLGKA